MAWNEGLQSDTPAFILASSTAHTLRAVAGPGSGKSFAIKRRIARLLESGIRPEEILAVTFTRAGAQDLKREISSIGIQGADEVHSRTLHSHALKLLMQKDVLASTGRTTRMVLDHEILPSLKDIENPEYPSIPEKRQLLSLYLSAWAQLQTDIPGYVKHPVQESFEHDLITWLKDHKGLLVGEVIPVVIDYLRSNPASTEIGKYKAILVDEYQDLNKSEQEFIRLIRGNADLVIVGDDDQSIYGFKYANPEGIREIEALHGEFTDIAFNECRRCPQKVTRMASALISKNPDRTLGDLVPHNNNNEGVVEIIQWRTYNDEIAGIPKIILNELGIGIIKPEDIMILAPRRKIGYLLRDQLLAAGLPVKSYFREAAIKNDLAKRAYSLLNLLAKPDDEIALRFLIGFGSPDFRKNQYKKLREIANEKELNLFETLNEVLIGNISPGPIKTIVEEFRKVVSDLNVLKQEIINSPTDGFQNMFIKNSEDEIEFYELNQVYRKAVQDEGFEILVDPSEFSNWIKLIFDCVQENITMAEAPEHIDHIRIMSLHSSKGLSAKFIILCSMIEQLIGAVPDDIEPEFAPYYIEEQRRLFYVAITRCKASNDYPGRLIISSFLTIYGLDAVKMGIKAKVDKNLNVLSTRFLKDFGMTSPQPVIGELIA